MFSGLLSSTEELMVIFYVVGSGKTAAFVLPMLTYISKLPPMTEEIEAEGTIFTCYLFFQSELSGFLFINILLFKHMVGLSKRDLIVNE